MKVSREMIGEGWGDFVDGLKDAGNWVVDNVLKPGLKYLPAILDLVADVLPAGSPQLLALKTALKVVAGVGKALDKIVNKQDAAEEKAQKLGNEALELENDYEDTKAAAAHADSEKAKADLKKKQEALKQKLADKKKAAREAEKEAKALAREADKQKKAKTKAEADLDKKSAAAQKEAERVQKLKQKGKGMGDMETSLTKGSMKGDGLVDKFLDNWLPKLPTPAPRPIVPKNPLPPTDSLGDSMTGISLTDMKPSPVVNPPEKIIPMGGSFRVVRRKIHQSMPQIKSLKEAAKETSDQLEGTGGTQIRAVVHDSVGMNEARELLAKTQSTAYHMLSRRRHGRRTIAAMIHHAR